MDNRRNAVLRVLLCTTRVQPSSSVRLTGWPGGQVADLRQLVDQVQVANAPLYLAEAEQPTAREFTVLLTCHPEAHGVRVGSFIGPYWFVCGSRNYEPR